MLGKQQFMTWKELTESTDLTNNIKKAYSTIRKLKKDPEKPNSSTM